MYKAPSVFLPTMLGSFKTYYDGSVYVSKLAEPQYSGTCSNIILDVSVKVFFNENNS